MCGIIGYTGKRNATGILLEGLAALEYRGYDSAGISVAGNGGIVTVRRVGRVSGLAEAVDEMGGIEGGCGIGHTRWATHGAPSEANAHPQASANLVLVHNGIIENYLELRTELSAAGYTFASDTDTECAAHLIDMYYRESHDPLSAIRRAAERLCGSYAFGIIFRDRPNEIYATRRDSPLIAAYTADGAYIASDIPALLPHTRRLVRLGEGETAHLAPDGTDFFDTDGRRIEKTPETVEWSEGAADKEGYPHFMLKEIHEQPDVIRRAATRRIGEDGMPELSADGIDDALLNTIDSIVITGCGSAMHAGLMGRMLTERLAGIPVTVELASEYRYSPPVTAGRTLLIPISQSGETSDTLQALRLAHKNGIPSLGLINVVGSAIARGSDAVMYTGAGPEIAVATTKGYSSQVTALAMLALRLGVIRGVINAGEAPRLCREIADTLPACIAEIISRRAEIAGLAQKIAAHDDLFYIGRGPDCPAAAECSLKLKEISYIHSEAYAAGELKHGTLSLVTEGTPVIALATSPVHYDKMTGNIREVRSRGGYVILVCAPDFPSPGEYADDVFILPAADPLFAPLGCVVFSQLLAYETALIRGCDVDHPRNLAKSVTVE